MGYLCGLVGLVAVWSSAMVYALPARPAWTTFSNTVAFLGTAALLGGLIMAVCARRATVDTDEEALPIRVGGWAAVVGALLMVVGLASTAMAGLQNAAVMKAVGLQVSSWLFWVQMLLGLALPIAVAAAMIVRAKEVTARVAVLGLTAALLGELAGRALFYASALGPSLWG